MPAEDKDSGVIKIGTFLGDYLEGVPNSKIYQLSRILYKNMDKIVKEQLDHPDAGFESFEKDKLKEFHKALVDKDYKKSTSILTLQLKALSSKKIADKPQTEFSFELGQEVPNDVIDTLHKDDNHEFFINDPVVVKRTDGKLVFGVVYLRIGGNILVSLGTIFKSFNPKDIWYF